ncbi:MAG: hypothetical protein QME65_02835 [Candidatus Omnitrophota bacterium]|nr:hypothetical protein [Candidatus Omnitrophota bacterium]
MRKYLKKLPKEIKGLIKIARKVAAIKKMPAYLVGGFVRDLILGVTNLDLDIVVEGNGIIFAEGLASRLKARLIRHKRFATATVTLKPQIKIDIATARKESYPQAAELPLVAAGTLKEDLLRRDFTINAMAINIFPGNFGSLVDLFGGERDLRRRRLRVLHDLSFIDDPTRILRAIRFKERYNFNIEPATLKLLKEALRAKMLERVEPQRVRDDLILSLKERHPLKNIRRIQALAGFDFIFPGLRPSRGEYRFIRSIESQITWFRKVYSRRRALDTWLMYFMGLIDPLRVKDTEEVCKKFAFRRGETKRILSFKNIKRKFVLQLSKSRINPSRIFSLLEPLSYEAILLVKAKYKKPNLKKHIEDFFEIYNGIRIYVSGKDLGGMGVAPGPVYKKIFTRVLNAKLNGQVKTKEQELDLIRKLIKWS